MKVLYFYGPEYFILGCVHTGSSVRMLGLVQTKKKKISPGSQFHIRHFIAKLKDTKPKGRYMFTTAWLVTFYYLTYRTSRTMCVGLNAHSVCA